MIFKLTLITFLYQSVSDATEQRTLPGKFLGHSSSSDESTSTSQPMSCIISFCSSCFMPSQIKKNKGKMERQWKCEMFELFQTKNRIIFFQFFLHNWLLFNLGTSNINKSKFYIKPTENFIWKGNLIMQSKLFILSKFAQ